MILEASRLLSGCSLGARCSCSSRSSLSFEEAAVLDYSIKYDFDLIDVVGFGESEGSFGVEAAEGGEELGALVFGEGGAEGVDGDVESATIGFEGEDGGHDVGGGGAEGEDEGVEVLEVGFVELWVAMESVAAR